MRSCELAACCIVLVVNGGPGLRETSFDCTTDTAKEPDSSAALTFAAVSPSPTSAVS
jgi:hypothetical protein